MHLSLVQKSRGGVHESTFLWHKMTSLTVGLTQQSSCIQATSVYMSRLYLLKTGVRVVACHLFSELVGSLIIDKQPIKIINTWCFVSIYFCIQQISQFLIKVSWQGKDGINVNLYACSFWYLLVKCYEISNTQKCHRGQFGGKLPFCHGGWSMSSNFHLDTFCWNL